MGPARGGLLLGPAAVCAPDTFAYRVRPITHLDDEGSETLKAAREVQPVAQGGG
jgi:hypothetical protein